MFYQRDFSRTERDDYILNILPKLNQFNEAVMIYDSLSNLIGWKIQVRYE